MSSVEVVLQEQFDPVDYFRSFCKNSIRPDGRKFSDYRQFSVRTKSVKATNVYGSSQVQIGKTIVTCGVNLMIGIPSMNEPSKGDIGVCVFSFKTTVCL
jgi:exosome complex RNA-binding protein Rrp42 (RNase PH superfamily)